MEDTLLYKRFAAAVILLRDGFLIDALTAFTAIADEAPDHELADDALYNAGLCHFHLNNFEQAVVTFRLLIEKYPEAAIYNGPNGREYGHTAAKAHYAIINCLLGLQNVEAARQELTALEKYADSYVITNLNEQVYYRDLGKAALATFQHIS